MTLAPRISSAYAGAPAAPAVLAIALAALLLFAAIGGVVLLGGQPLPAAQAATHLAPAQSLAKAGDPLCAAALVKARDTRGLDAPAAIAASTAMLRACDVR